MHIFASNHGYRLYTICKLSFLLGMLIGGNRVKAGIDPDLQNHCNKDPSGMVAVMLEHNLPSTKTTFQSGSIGHEKYVNNLKTQSSAIQPAIVNAIKSIHPNAEPQRFWISPVIAMNANCSKIGNLANISGVTNVRKQQMPRLQVVGSAVQATGNSAVATGVQWGITKIRAPDVWKVQKNAISATTRPIIVASCDSGVRSSHNALKNNYRGGNCSWYDATTDSTDSTPTDDNGHGTHTMGTMCGQNGIGVAPNAQWITCKCCKSDGSCPEDLIIACGQWICCPYMIINGQIYPDCSKRPDIVNNSWGGADTGSTFFDTILQCWITAGIKFFFAAGNSGPGCSSVGYPADSSFCKSSVGATTENDTVPSFSSLGPAFMSGTTKPELAAPGSNVLSSYNTGDDSYMTLSGTSMATPHVAGACALLLAKNPNLTLDEVMAKLQTTTFRPTLIDICSCLAIFKSPLFCYFLGTSAAYPNNMVGYGIINVAAAYNAI